MRLIDILSPPVPLLERTIVNIDEMRATIDGLSSIFPPEAQSWFKSQLFKYLVNRETNPRAMIPVRNYDYRELALMPEWMKADFKKGEAYKFNTHWTAWLETESRTVANWFAEQGKQGRNPLRRGMSWEQARDAAKKAKKKADAEAAKSKEEREGTFLVKEYSEGLYWVRIDSRDCLNREGERMANCLKDASIEEGTRHYSLRNANNRPLVTMSITELRGDDAYDDEIGWMEGEYKSFVSEVQGFANEKVGEEYYPYIADLIMLLKVYVNKWNEAADILRQSGYVLDEETGEPQSSANFKADARKIMDTSTGKEWYAKEKTTKLWGGLENQTVYLLFDGDVVLFKVTGGFSEKHTILSEEPYVPDTRSSKAVVERVGKDFAELVIKERLIVMDNIYYGYDLATFGVPANQSSGYREE